MLGPERGGRTCGFAEPPSPQRSAGQVRRSLPGAAGTAARPPRPPRPAPPPPGPARRTPGTRARAGPCRLHLLRGAPRPLNWLRELPAPPAPRGTLETVVRRMAGPRARGASRNPKPSGFGYRPAIVVGAKLVHQRVECAYSGLARPFPVLDACALRPGVHAGPRCCSPQGSRESQTAFTPLPMWISSAVLPPSVQKAEPRGCVPPNPGLSPPPPATEDQDSEQEKQSPFRTY